MLKRIAAVLLLLISCATVSTVHAEDVSARRLLARAETDPELKARLTQAGKAAANFCFNCHGDKGISKLSDVPNLAGQHPAYIIDQIEAFLSGRRTDEFMQGLMKLLSEEEKASAALFFATSTPIPARPAPGPRAIEGKQLYAEYCARCHRDDAAGEESFPRLAGQQPDYMRRSLTRYFDMTGERLYPPMTGAVRQLGKHNIEAIVDYLSAKY